MNRNCLDVKVKIKSAKMDIKLSSKYACKFSGGCLYPFYLDQVGFHSFSFKILYWSPLLQPKKVSSSWFQQLHHFALFSLKYLDLQCSSVVRVPGVALAIFSSPQQTPRNFQGGYIVLCVCHDASPCPPFCKESLHFHEPSVCRDLSGNTAITTVSDSPGYISDPKGLAFPQDSELLFCSGPITNTSPQ